MQIRELRLEEVPFVEDMLYAAQVVVFHAGWGHAGDVGLVAEQNGQPIGLVWYRFFTDKGHGEGFVDEETPEVAIAVVDGYRGRGVGKLLMETIHARARADGVERISLSVDRDNPARRLYERLGYVELEPDHEDGRMILELA